MSRHENISAEPKLANAGALVRGQNVPLSTHAATLTIEVSGARMDIVAFQLTSTRKVRSDSDFVFFNQPQSPEGAISLTGAGKLSINLTTVPSVIDHIAIGLAAEAPLGGIPLVTTITDDTGTTITAPAQGLTTEQAAVLVELYRRGGQWKVRSESAGWDAGFAGLVREFGVTVDEEPDSPAANAVTAAPAPVLGAAPKIRVVAGEGKLSLEKRRVLNLRKEAVHRALLTKGAAGCDARVILVLDKTMSMAQLYQDGTVKRVIERMIPIATQLDSDGNLETYLYGQHYVKLPDVTVANADQWIDTFVHLHGTHGHPMCSPINYDKQIGGFNQELPIMSAILDGLRNLQPVLVLFFTDGGFHSKVPQIRKLISTAASRPVFWQFIGLGDNNFGILTQLDTMQGRIVDNAGFFRVVDIDSTTDTELYDALIGEFPDWMRAATAHRIIDPRYTAPTNHLPR
ncbi:VWA domain-containing protein [Nocardia sp. NPDC059246]|uniref:vWA domain-containing protein n=1 Tax=unclassified Nocardia TaxID=2637762 RepID=UPI0036A88153